MYDISERSLRALNFSHEIRHYVRVRQAGVTVTPEQYATYGVPVKSGMVNVNSDQHVRRTLTGEIVLPDLPQADIDALFQPYGTELSVWRGIRFFDTIEWIQLGTFRIDKAGVKYTQDSNSSLVSITGSDRAVHISDARFEVTEQSAAGTVVNEIRRLVSAAMPSYVPLMVDTTGSSMACTRQTYDDKDRAAAIDKLAASIGAELIIKPDGTPWLRPVPTMADTPVWTIFDGDVGNMVEITKELSRESIYNAVVASGEALDGTAPVYYIARDTLSTSPTKWGGSFGKRPTFISSPNWKTVAACMVGARAQLAKYSGRHWEVSVTSLPNPALECGDVVAITLPDGELQNHIVDSFSLTLGTGGDMPMTTRSNEPGGDS